MKLNTILALIVCMIVVAAGFYALTEYEGKDGVTDTKTYDDDNIEAVGNITSFNEAVNAFAFNFYKKFYNDPNNVDDIFLSPYSIFTALAMAYEGAEGLTAEEMASVLNIKQDNESFHEYMLSLYEHLNENTEYNISTANGLWQSLDYELLQEYIDVITTYYGGEVAEIDFSNPEEAANIINSWVENKTNQLIKDLISAGDINPDLTTLILTNAIYFKGTWEVQFDVENTTDMTFTTQSAEDIEVPTMCLTGTEDKFNYTENEDMQILELPYSGNEISMMIFLPKEGKDLSGIIDDMNKDSYSDLIESMTENEVDIYLPRFKIKTPLYELNDYLKELGMASAFGPGANFSGLDGIGDTYISKVLHKAYIDVNEEGTEAAAATAIVFFRTGVGDDSETRITFDCDHPFLFTIHHKETNTVLFMGNVNNPVE